jgi:hypothetical protein
MHCPTGVARDLCQTEVVTGVNVFTSGGTGEAPSYTIQVSTDGAGWQTVLASNTPAQQRPLESPKRRCHTAPVARWLVNFAVWVLAAASAPIWGCSEKSACSCPPNDDHITVDNGCWTGVTVTTAGWCLATWGPPDDVDASCQSSAWVTAIGTSDGPCTVWIDMPDGRRYQADITIHTETGECCSGQHIRLDSPVVAVDSGAP